MSFLLFISPLSALLLSPFLLGVINRTKAFFGGRTGQPLLQAYYDLWKLMKKGAVYSRTTSWVFRAGPIVSLASILMALTLVPLGKMPAPLFFQGDLILFAYLLALGRFFTILAGLDTGSSFEGMGASREAQFSALAEIAFLLGLAAIAVETKHLSLSSMMATAPVGDWTARGAVHLLVGAAFLAVFLTENARIPVDDPNTHLELTMIHEVIVLDHGGVDLAYILYGSALKLWILGVLLVETVFPFHFENPWLEGAALIVAMFALAIFVGVIESTMSRFRLRRVPHLLVGAAASAVLALGLVLR